MSQVAPGSHKRKKASNDNDALEWDPHIVRTVRTMLKKLQGWND